MNANKLLVWLSIVGGALGIIGVIVGAAITYGEHHQADVDNGVLIQELKHDLRAFDARIDMLERSHDFHRPDDVQLFVPHAERTP